MFGITDISVNYKLSSQSIMLTRCQESGEKLPTLTILSSFQSSIIHLSN